MKTALLSRADRSAQTARLLLEAAATRDTSERSRILGRVVVLNCRIADAVAARYRDRGVPLEDLRQVAYEGLIKAVHRFDPEHADDLLTFAVPTIRGEVQRHFRDRSWMVRPPRRLQQLQARAHAVTASLQGSLGREPATREICAALGIGHEEYTEMMLALGCFTPPSLDQPLGEGRTWADLVADGGGELAAMEARCLLEPAMGELSSRDRRVLHLRFVEERSQREIGDALGITQTQVSRVLERILRDLRRTLEPV